MGRPGPQGGWTGDDGALLYYALARPRALAELMRQPAPDAHRSARLLIGEELAAGALDPSAIRDVAGARRRPWPRLPVALAGPLQRIGMKRGRLGYESTLVPRDQAARRLVLGDRAAGPPRVLVRVDEFPHARAADRPSEFGTERFRQFHEIMATAGVPYLVALMPRVSRDYLDPAASGERALDAGEVDLIRRLASEDVAFGLHGRNHRTRDARPRHHSELAGLTAGALEELLDDAGQTLSDATGVRPRVFVAPFNRFDRAHYRVISRRFDIVTGGPETVRILGLSPTPEWRGDAVYLPSYPPLYGRAREVAEGVERLARGGAALWAPAVIHWGEEQEDDWSGLRRAAEILAPYAARWQDFAAAVARSREIG